MRISWKGISLLPIVEQPAAVADALSQHDDYREKDEEAAFFYFLKTQPAKALEFAKGQVAVEAADALVAEAKQAKRAEQALEATRAKQPA